MTKLFKIIILILVLCCSVSLSACQKDEKPVTGSDNEGDGVMTTNKELTIEDLKAMDPQYEKLCSVNYYHGGGMEGSDHHRELKKNDDGSLTYTVTNRNFVGAIGVCKVYEIKDQDLFDTLEAYVKEYNLSVWDKLPEEEFFALDAPSTSLTLGFKPEGKKYLQTMTISYDRQFPEGGYEVLNNFLKIIAEQAGDLKDLYYNDRGEYDFRIGKDIENTDEEIGLVLQDYWRNEEMSVEANDYEKTLSIFINQEEEVYKLKKTVHETLDDHNSSWYRIYVSTENEDKLYYVTLDDDVLILKDEQTVEHLCERY
ncbi:MAG: hypothetical protein IJI46_08595 [Erysipelotrichaceae bacterium]|nr:hypothetical protein [Erysipelotrichaceae bacterium]